MWNPEAAGPQPSFLVPVGAPTPQPGAMPTVCVPLNADWVPFVLGALAQLLLPTTCDGISVSIPEMQARATDLLVLFATALPCMQFALRYEPDCSLQFSTDGGVTGATVPGWVPNFANCIKHTAPGLVMADGIIYPPVPVTTEDGADWVYAG